MMLNDVIKRIAMIFTIFFLMQNIHVQAEDEEVLSGQELLAGCEEGRIPGEPSQYCMRYVFGLVQTIDMLQQTESGLKLFCIGPNKIGLQEVTMKVENWLSNNTDRLNEDAYVLVSQALNSLYPCRLKGV